MKLQIIKSKNHGVINNAIKCFIAQKSNNSTENVPTSVKPIIYTEKIKIHRNSIKQHTIQ